jgi:hypothetical protein
MFVSANSDWLTRLTPSVAVQVTFMDDDDDDDGDLAGRIGDVSPGCERS